MVQRWESRHQVEGTHMEVKAQGQTWVRYTPSKALVKEGCVSIFLLRAVTTH